MTVAILSLILVVPVLSAIIWQWRSRAHWNSLAFGVAAFAVIGLLRIPLNDVLALPQVRALFDIPPPGLVMRIPIAWILFSVVHALFREGLRGLFLVFPATSVRTWKEGVMFGLGYTWPAAVQALKRYVAQYWEEIETSRYSLVEAVEFLNSMHAPELAGLAVLDMSIALPLFNVGTCLVVMLSVKRRSVWLFLAAILWNVAYSQLPRIVLFNFPELEDRYLDWLLTLVSPTLAKTAVALLPFLVLVSLRRR